MEFLELLLGTIWLRPYVFIFLLSYLIIAILHMGVKRSLLFTLLSFAIAFVAEYSSTRNGLPFGYYTYIETTRGQELWISNVPFMDTISFSFLSYISYTLSLFLWCPLKKSGWDIRLVESNAIKYSWRVILTGAVLMMMLDVVIDPVSFLGDRLVSADKFILTRSKGSILIFRSPISAAGLSLGLPFFLALRESMPG